MRKRVLFGLAGGGIFAAGLLIGMMTNGFSVFASSSSPANTTASSASGNYCQLYAQTLANDLHVTTAQLQQANQDALQKVIDQMYADGKITAAQKSKLEARLQQLSQRRRWRSVRASPGRCAHPDRSRGGRGTKQHAGGDARF
jgi:hypothetical protein